MKAVWKHKLPVLVEMDIRHNTPSPFLDFSVTFASTEKGVFPLAATINMVEADGVTHAGNGIGTLDELCPQGWDLSLFHGVIQAVIRTNSAILEELVRLFGAEVYGIFGADVMVRMDGVWFQCEINARNTASTIMKEVMDGLSAKAGWMRNVHPDARFKTWMDIEAALGSLNWENTDRLVRVGAEEEVLEAGEGVVLMNPLCMPGKMTILAVAASLEQARRIFEMTERVLSHVVVVELFLADAPVAAK
jgi:hypothetical protein